MGLFKKKKPAGATFYREEDPTGAKKGKPAFPAGNAKGKSKTGSKKEKAKKQKKHASSIPRSLQDSIPYINVYEKGIIEVREGVFTKSYRLPEANFRMATNDTQKQLVEAWGDFLSAFPPEALVEATVCNRTIDIDEFQQETMLEMQMDGLNQYREEYNEMLGDKMSAAKNNLVAEKYLTVAIPAKNIAEASETFSGLDALVSEKMSHIVREGVTPLGTVERLDILNSIYNPDSRSLMEEHMVDGRKVKAFSLENCIQQGITTKEAIAPPGIQFKGNMIDVGECVARSYYISNYPTWIKGNMISSFSDIPANMLVSVYFDAMPQEKAYKLIKNQSTNIRGLLVEKSKKANQGGYSQELISPDLADAKADTGEIQDSLTKENARLFTTTVIFTLFAKDKDELESLQKDLYLAASKNLITVRPLNYQMEDGFNSSLPLGNCSLLTGGRLMTTNSVSGIVPFDVLECRHKGGFYYGLNAISHNMILCNRALDLNPCGIILGVPGSGKSFASKREIVNVVLDSNDEVYVIDPESEHTQLAKLLGGTVVKIANGGTNYLNPFDLDLRNTGDDGDAVRVAVDYITSLCEIAIGGRYGLSPIDRTIIDRCTTNVYKGYVEYLKRTGKDIDIKESPTMEDFYDELLEQPEEEARTIALALERFVSGAYDLFSHRTNVDIENRFTVFDIKDIGTGLLKMGLHIALNHIWNKMIKNRSEGKRTWIYIDEFYLLMAEESSAAYISQIWKRARKWNGIPTAITQNVEDMLNSPQARTVINNSSFVMLLAQAPINRKQLSSIFSLSPAEQRYISRSKAGMGLIKIGDSIIPMDDSFPKDTMLYKIMTSKPGETIEDIS